MTASINNVYESIKAKEQIDSDTYPLSKNNKFHNKVNGYDKKDYLDMSKEEKREYFLDNYIRIDVLKIDSGARIITPVSKRKGV